MTISHWDILPDNLKGLVYQFDNTAKLKFNEVLDELDLKFNKGFTVKCYHRYSPSTDIDYRVILFKIQMRRKSKVSKCYVKRTQGMLISLCDLQPREFNERAGLFAYKGRQLLKKWVRFANEYLDQTRWLMSVFKRNNGLMYRLLN